LVAKEENKLEKKDEVFNEKLENLKKQFIVDDDSLEEDELEEFLERTLKLCRISSGGKVILRNMKTSQKNKIGVIILARGLGNTINSEISKTVTIDEVFLYSNIDKNTISSRVSELVKEGFISKEEEGIYRFNFAMINEFLENL